MFFAIDLVEWIGITFGIMLRQIRNQQKLFRLYFDTIMIFDQAVNRWDFIDFLKHLRAINDDKRIHCFLDNLSAHKTIEVLEEYIKLNINPIWNVPYRYDFLPIELVFSQVKRIYKKAKLSAPRVDLSGFRCLIW